MATVSSSKVADTVPTRTPHNGVVAVKATYAVPASGDGTAADDIIQMVKVPKGATILDVTLTSEDLDSNGTPTIVLDVGDGDDPDRFIDGSNVAQAGGVARLGSGVAAAATDGLFYTYTAEDTIDVKVVTAAATKAAGNITLAVLYTMED